MHNNLGKSWHLQLNLQQRANLIATTAGQLLKWPVTRKTAGRRRVSIDKHVDEPAPPSFTSIPTTTGSEIPKNKHILSARSNMNDDKKSWQISSCDQSANSERKGVSDLQAMTSARSYLVRWMLVVQTSVRRLEWIGREIWTLTGEQLSITRSPNGQFPAADGWIHQRLRSSARATNFIIIIIVAQRRTKTERSSTINNGRPSNEG